MAGYITAIRTREWWRKHCLEYSDRYKARNTDNPPSRRGKKRCPRCQNNLSKKQFCIAVRQPDGLRQYCNACNSLLVRIWYWRLKLKECPSPADKKKVLKVIGMKFPESVRKDIIKVAR